MPRPVAITVFAVLLLSNVTAAAIDCPVYAEELKPMLEHP